MRNPDWTIAIVYDIITNGILGLLGGMFSLTSAGITAAIVFGFIFSLIFKAKD